MLNVYSVDAYSADAVGPEAAPGFTPVCRRCGRRSDKPCMAVVAGSRRAGIGRPGRWQIAADVAVDEQVHFAGVAPVFAGCGRHLVRIHTGYEARCDQHDEFGFLPLVPHRPEQRSDDRQIAQQRRDRFAGSLHVREQSTDGERLAFGEFHAGLDLAKS